MCIVTNLKYIITVCYDVIILYNFLPMHSFFFSASILSFFKVCKKIQDSSFYGYIEAVQWPRNYSVEWDLIMSDYVQLHKFTYIPYILYNVFRLKHMFQFHRGSG